jgi:acyl-CoA thioesterase
VETFAEASAVRPAGPDVWGGAIQPGWDIAGNANGGYLMAIGTRALIASTGRADPVSVTAHFLAPGKPGPVSVRTAVVKEGKRFATATALLRATDRPVLSLVGSTGELDRTGDHQRPEDNDRPEGYELVDSGPPDLPPPDECFALVATDTFPPPFMGHVDLRLHPDDAGFARGEASGRPLMRGWFRFAGGEPIDTVGLLVAVDAFPPTIFNARQAPAWTPTLELTAHIRARPDPGWLRCRFATRFVTGGFLEEDGEIWDGSDRLVAQSRQLALVPRH